MSLVFVRGANLAIDILVPAVRHCSLPDIRRLEIVIILLLV